jgi:hypothetical protein
MTIYAALRAVTVVVLVVSGGANAQTAHDFHGVWDLESIRKSAENNPDGTVECGFGGPHHVYMTYAVCYAAMAFLGDNYNKMKPLAGDEFLYQCSTVSRAVCLTTLEEMRNLSSKVISQSKGISIHECADRLAKEFSGGERTQYLNMCQQLVAYFK